MKEKKIAEATSPTRTKKAVHLPSHEVIYIYLITTTFFLRKN